MDIKEIRNNKPRWATHYLKHPDKGYSKYIKETSTHFVFFQYGQKWGFTKDHMRNLGEVIKL